MTAPQAQPHRAADGTWLCNAAPGCDAPAVIQWPHPEPTEIDPGRTVPVFACAAHEP